MSTIKRFEDLKIWIMARDIYKEILILTMIIRKNRDYRLADQMKGSSVSIMDNIAEGFGRASILEFINHLGIGNGEANELQSQLYRCLDDKYVTLEKFENLYEQVNQLKKSIMNFIFYLNSTEIKGIKFKGRT